MASAISCSLLRKGFDVLFLFLVGTSDQNNQLWKSEARDPEKETQVLLVISPLRENWTAKKIKKGKIEVTIW